MLQNPSIQQASDQSLFELSRNEFKTIINPYKLSFSEQLRFNQEFAIETDRPASSSAEDLKNFLKDKINVAFQNQDKLQRYHEAIGVDRASSDRGIHDGYHVANVALYARNFLKIYQQNKELFSPEIQKQIEEFDNPQKVKDLEILCLLHDVARINKDLDQDEYKNAFYVALMLREAGDERFQGDEINEEGLKMIMDLASKESNNKDKSLMSKLIQGSDSLAILRIRKFNSNQNLFKPNLNNIYNDFKNIDPKNNLDKRNKLITIWMGRMQSDILSIENKERTEITPIEFAENPLEYFLNHQKTKKLNQAFLVYDEINSEDKKKDFSIEQSYGAIFVHVLVPYNHDALQKCDSKKFICATMLRDGANVKHYAEWSWNNNPFLILDKDATIFQAGFTTDVGSDVLNISYKNYLPVYFGGFQSDIEMSNYVASKWQGRPSQAYFDNMIFHQDAFYLKLKENSDRRSGSQTDISDGIYWLTDGSGNRKQGQVGAERFGAEYSKPYFFREALSSELRHNECHVRNSVHISHGVGISDNTFNFLPTANHQYSDSPESGLLRLKKYKDQINAEKKRLLDLDNPMEDEKFRQCVDFELSKVTSLFEKIHFLQQMRKEIKDNPDNQYWIKSSQKKQMKKSQFDDFTFEISDVNRDIWSDRKIAKINKNLVELFAKLREFEKDENFGFKDLISEYDHLTTARCNSLQFGTKIADWKSRIMDGKTYPDQLQFAIKKVNEGLQKETKMIIHNIYKPQEFMVLTDEQFAKRFKEITSDPSKQEKIFNAFFKNKEYLQILQIFNRERITEIFPKINKSKNADFDKIVFENKFQNSTKEEIEELINAGLDIHKFNDKDTEAGCFGFGNSQVIQPYSYEIAKKFNNPKAVESLLEHGVLISDKLNLTESEVEKNMAEFCKKLKNNDSEVLNSLKLALEKYQSKENLKDVTILSFGGKYIKLNGYGLLRLFENNLIQNPSSEISELFTKINSFKALGRLNNATLSSVHADIVFSISSTPDPAIFNPDNTSTFVADTAGRSDPISTADSSAGAYPAGKVINSKSTQVSPPNPSNSMSFNQS